VRAPILLTLGLFGFYLLIAWAGPLAVGLWQDDAIYLCTAKSLAAGTGYRHAEIPGEPLQTKYPILYPAILSLIFRLSPPYPQNVPLLLIPGALAAAGLVTLAVRYWRNVLGASTGLVWPAGLLAAFSPVTLSFVRFTMSDLPYAFLALAAVYVLDHKYATQVESNRRRMWLVAGAILIAAAVLTRGIGITLIPATVLVLLWRKRFRDAALVIAILVVCLAPWYVRQAMAARANGAMQSAFLEAPELSYSLWLPESAGQAASVVLQNVFRGALGIGYLQLALPQDAIGQALTDPSWRTACLHLVCYAAVVMILVGFLRSARTSVRTLHLYAVFYTGLMLAWPFEPYRFLIPWTPFLLYFLLDGLRGVCRLIPRAHLAGVAFWATVAVIGACFLYDDVRIADSTASRYQLREFPIDWTEMRAVERWVAQNTEADAVIASAHPASLFLATGRQGHYFWPDTDPYALYYGVDRTWRTFYALPAASERRYLEDQMRERLLDVYRSAGIRYCIEHTGLYTSGAVLAPLLRRHPELFEPCFRTPRRTYTAFRVKWSVR